MAEVSGFKGAKRGSALLVVLGFLSFMVVSAVAFAIFMRSERAPSSAVRRGIATRHLVKAALARAIGDVDDAVRGHVYPGLPSRTQTPYSWAGQEVDNWYGRVFMPPDSEGTTVDPNSRFAPIGDTVSVLNLEALGYLPPGLVNDVRFLSRCTWSARWRNFPYDAGRYAYVAVNVSDFFDVNELKAVAGRFSADSQRISLASCFTDANRETEAAAAKTFSEFLRNRGGTHTDWPFVSMMDYNLALGGKFSDGGFGSIGYNSPFWSWISGANAKSELWYRDMNTNENSKTAAALKQPFITGSWFPERKVPAASEEAGAVQTVPLESINGQPFGAQQAGLMANSKDVQAIQPVGITTEFKNVLQNQRGLLNLGDWVTLFDYLDRDSVPLSVAQPCVERVPMTAAIEPMVPYTFKAKLERAQKDEPENHAGPPAMPYNRNTTTTITFDSGHIPQVAALRAVFAYPFKRGKLDAATYRATALVKMFFVMAEQQDAKYSLLRAPNLIAGLRPTESEWNSPQQFKLAQGGDNVAVVTYRGEQTLQVPQEAVDEDEAFCGGGAVAMNLSLQGAATKIFARHTKTQPMTAADAPDGQPTYSWEFPEARPFGIDGTPIEDVAGASDDKYATWHVRPYLAAWVKIETNDGLVDYIPAILEDDNQIGGMDNGLLAQLEGQVPSGSSAGVPILPFSDNSQPVSIQDVMTRAESVPPGSSQEYSGQPSQFAPKSYMAVDPRFNWAPEDWLPRSTAANANEWLDFLHANVLGKEGRSPDIFLSVSDEGYLQSMGELALLPRRTDDSGAPVAVTFDGKARDVDCPFTAAAHAGVAWRHYPADYMLGSAGLRKQDGHFGAEMPIRDAGTGFRVNPYTESKDVMRAVFANTPHDWRVAGTNNVAYGGNDRLVALKKQMQENAGDALKHTYSGHSDDPGAKLHPDDVDRIAALFMNEFRSRPDEDWEEVYDSVWQSYANEVNQDPGMFFGGQLKNGVLLHESDRKFLYAFWRGCFANRQQLFLIFVRAESGALGGTGEGAPSQTGGRAVALVWRDPETDGAHSDDRDGGQNFESLRRPHRTRVLFYHQLD